MAKREEADERHRWRLERDMLETLAHKSYKPLELGRLIKRALDTVDRRVGPESYIRGILILCIYESRGSAALAPAFEAWIRGLIEEAVAQLRARDDDDHDDDGRRAPL